MANKRQRKKNAKNALKSYEGQQYRGGRQAGRKNLIRSPDGFINQHGVNFSTAERAELERLVNRVNYKRKKLIEIEGKSPRRVQGNPTGDTVQERQRMGYESDFIVARRSKSLQRFKSREQYEKYLDSLNKVLEKDYVSMRVKLYRDNYVAALENAFGEEADDIVSRVKNMTAKEFMENVQSDDLADISFIYDPKEMGVKLNSLRKSWQIPLKDTL